MQDSGPLNVSRLTGCVIIVTLEHSQMPAGATECCSASSPLPVISGRLLWEGDLERDCFLGKFSHHLLCSERFVLLGTCLHM